MKKLMIAAAIVCAAVVSQAASCNWDWKTSYSGKIYQAGTTTTLGSGTAYIFALDGAGAVTQQAVLDAFLADETWTAGNLNNKAVDAGAIKATSGTAFSYGDTAGIEYKFFVALVDGDNIFISDSFKGNGDMTSYSQMSIDAKAASQKAAMESSTFTAGGWYAAAVPEPTSGLLLLLGVAGLALRRRRA